MFRNIRLYRVHGDWPDSEESLSEKLTQVAFKPCGSFSEHSAGWEPPAENVEGDPLCRRVGGADLMRLRRQSRLLPPAAVKEALQERIETFRDRTRRDPSRMEKRDLKEEVFSELLPKALLKSDRIHGFYLHSEAILGIETASEPQAELFLDSLREALGSLQAIPLAFKRAPAELMTRIFLGDGPREFMLGRECRMVDPVTGPASVNWLDMDLAEGSVRHHVRSGLKLSRLGIGFDSLFNCVIDDLLVLRKVKLEGQDSVDDLPDEDPLARLDAEFVMIAGCIARLLAALKKHLGGYDG